MDNPIEFLGDAFQGDIEVAGKRIPKIALVGGGGVIIVILILLSRRSGGSTSLSPASVPTGDSSGVGSPGLVSDDAGGIDTGTVTTDLGALQESFAQQLADTSSQLTDLISQNSAAQADDLNAQLSSVYDQLAQVGSQVTGGYSDNYAPLPMDYGYAMPVDTGFASIPVSSGYSVNSFVPQATSPKPVTKDIIDKIKPSNVKPQGGTPIAKATAKLGAALKPGKSGVDKVSQLGSAPKQNQVTSAILGFNRKQPTIGILGKQPKQPGMIPSPVPSVSKTREKSNASSLSIAKKPVAIPTTIKTPMVSGVSKVQKKPTTAQPAKLSKTPAYLSPVAKTNPKPVVSYPKPAPIPIYRPPLPTFVTPFRSIPIAKIGKVTSTKKGK